MGDLAGAVGNGIGSLVSRSVDVIGDTIGGLVHSVSAIVPGGGLVLLVGALVIGILAWNVLRRA